MPIAVLHDTYKDTLKCFHGKEREDAVYLLILLGIKHFELAYNKRPMQICLLKSLVEKYFTGLESSKNNLKPKIPVTRKIYRNRESRSDAMYHFPFADNSGTVSEILHNQGQESFKHLLEMGSPARTKLIQKIFQEMRLDKRGVRLCDVPEALSRLGISISEEMSRVLQQSKIPPSQDDYAEVYLSFEQWRSVVERFLHLLWTGQDLNDISAQILELVSEGGSNCSNDEFKGDDDDFSQIDMGSEQQQEFPFPDPRTQQKGFQNPNTKNSKNSTNPYNPHKNHSTKSAKHRTTSKAVQSRLGPQINRDRSRHYRNKTQEENAVQRALAKRRVQDLLSSAPQVDTSSRRPVKPHLNERKKDQNLDSGSTARSITDSFLQGPVGRELTQGHDYLSDLQVEVGGPSSGGGLFPRSLSPLQAQRKATAMLGLERRPSLGDDHPDFIPLPPGPSRLGFGHRSVQERWEDRVAEQEAKRRYEAPGWTPARGGWVADFGPVHTHPLYRGAEVHRISLDEKLGRAQAEGGKEVSFSAEDQGGLGIMDDMLAGMAREVSSDRRQANQRREKRMAATQTSDRVDSRKSAYDPMDTFNAVMTVPVPPSVGYFMSSGSSSSNSRAVPSSSGSEGDSSVSAEELAALAANSLRSQDSTVAWMKAVEKEERTNLFTPRRSDTTGVLDRDSVAMRREYSAPAAVFSETGFEEKWEGGRLESKGYSEEDLVAALQDSVDIKKLTGKNH